MTPNPKMTGSDCVDCIPQGEPRCPLNCTECFFNLAPYMQPDELPLMPNPDEVNRDGLIVRVNGGGHDSNTDREHVIGATKCYTHRFYNTRITLFNFGWLKHDTLLPAPVIFTCNGGKPLFAEVAPNVMAVRIRAVCWPDETQDKLVDYYTEQGVPVLMTFMRYHSWDILHTTAPLGSFVCYRESLHVSNSWICPMPHAVILTMERYKGKGVRMCGTPWSSLCVDCGHCAELYWAYLGRNLT